MKRNFKKIVYPAGIISIVLFPICCVSSLFIKGVFSKEHVLPIAWIAKQSERNVSVLDDAIWSLPFSRRYTRVTITSNEGNNKKYMTLAQKKIRELYKLQDTVAGVQFHFTEDARFEDFIAAVELCRKENVKTYAPLENDIWVLIPSPPRPIDPSKEKIPMLTCGTGNYNFLNGGLIQEAETQEEEKEIEFFRSSMEKYRVSIFLFGLLLFFAIRRAFRTSKKHVTTGGNYPAYLYRLKRYDTDKDHN